MPDTSHTGTKRSSSAADIGEDGLTKRMRAILKDCCEEEKTPTLAALSCRLLEEEAKVRLQQAMGFEDLGGYVPLPSVGADVLSIITAEFVNSPFWDDVPRWQPPRPETPAEPIELPPFDDDVFRSDAETPRAG